NLRIYTFPTRRSSDLLEVAGVAANGFLYPQITELANVVDIMGRGILFADAITTVSERYSQEILTPTFGEKLDHLLRSRRERLFRSEEHTSELQSPCNL